jgi:hypothetical protein
MMSLLGEMSVDRYFRLAIKRSLTLFCRADRYFRFAIRRSMTFCCADPLVRRWSGIGMPSPT